MPILQKFEQHEPPGPTPRAQRFPILAPVWYRANGKRVWSPGVAVNISRSGILFRAKKEIEPRTLLEVRIVFPEEITGGVPIDVVCWGPVVRREGFSLAASIVKYHFKHE